MTETLISIHEQSGTKMVVAPDDLGLMIRYEHLRPAPREGLLGRIADRVVGTGTRFVPSSTEYRYMRNTPATFYDEPATKSGGYVGITQEPSLVQFEQGTNPSRVYLPLGIPTVVTPDDTVFPPEAAQFMQFMADNFGWAIGEVLQSAIDKTLNH